MADHTNDGLPAITTQQRSQLRREDLRTLIRLLTYLRGYFELPETFKKIDDTLEIVHALSEDYVRQAAERQRQRERVR